eukprot:89242-Chlamydomonas_euryale.AAC.1
MKKRSMRFQDEPASSAAATYCATTGALWKMLEKKKGLLKENGMEGRGGGMHKKREGCFGAH